MAINQLAYDPRPKETGKAGKAGGGGLGTAIGTGLGAVAGGALGGGLTGGAGTAAGALAGASAGASLGGTLGGLAGQQIAPGQADTRAAMQRRSAQFQPLEHQRQLDNSLAALSTQPPAVQQEFAPTLIKAKQMSAQRRMV